jgi:hypothetical protein
VEESLRGLAAVTQLQDLSVKMGCAFDVASLLPLTSLTAVTEFLVVWTPSLSIRLEQAGSRPAVWLQLLEKCCAEDPGCQPVAICSLAQQLAEQRALTAQQQQVIAVLQRQVQELPAELQQQ